MMKRFIYVCAMALAVFTHATAQSFTNVTDAIYGASAKWSVNVNNYAGLKAALDKAGNDKMYIILISGDITMSDTYSLSNKKVALRKIEGTVEKPWDFNKPWITTNLDETKGATGGVISKGQAVRSPDLYDGTSDFNIYNPSGKRHFTITGTSTLYLENITLNGGVTSDVAPGGEPAALSGGIYAQTAFTFAGNIRDQTGNWGGDLRYGAISFAQSLDVKGGFFYHNQTALGGAFYCNSNPNSVNITNVVIEKCSSINEGGAAYLTGVTVNWTNSIIRNNRAYHGSGGIELFSGAKLNLGKTDGTSADNSLLFEGNRSCSAPSQGNSSAYPANGGALELSNGATCNIYNGTTFRNNQAERGGGAISIVNNSDNHLYLYGGIIENNKALGIVRGLDPNASDQDRYAIGGGGAIYSYDPSYVTFGKGCTTKFRGNTGNYIAHIKTSDVPANYKTNVDIATMGNSTGITTGDYANLYNGYDIGSPNNLPHGNYAKIELLTSPAGAGVINESAAQKKLYVDALGTGEKWLEMNQSTKLTYSATANPGYIFSGWTYSSPANLLASEWNTVFGKTVGTSISDNPLKNFLMPDATVVLTANFAKAAQLSGMEGLQFPVQLDAAGKYAAMSRTLSLINDGSVAASSVKLTLGNLLRDEDGQSFAPDAYLTVSGATSVAAGATEKYTVALKANGGLTGGTYRSTLTLSYADGSGRNIEQTAEVLIGVVPPGNALSVVSELDFAPVFIGYTQPDAKSITIMNYGLVDATITNITLAGGNSDCFTLTPSGAVNVTIAGGKTADVASVRPNVGLPAGMYATLAQVTYRFTNPSGTVVTKTAHGTVTFCVLSPAVLSLQPDIDGSIRFGAQIGYDLTSVPIQSLPIINKGDMAATIKMVSVSDNFMINVSADLNVPARDGDKSGVNNSWGVAPKANLAAGTYYGQVTIVYDDGHDNAAANYQSATHWMVFRVTSPKDLAAADFTLSASSFVYDGTEHKPTVAPVIDLLGNTVSPNYYSVAYANNKNAGTGSVTIKPTAAGTAAGYTDSLAANFTISQRPITVSNPQPAANIAAKTYDATTAVTVNAISFSNMADGETFTVNSDYGFSASLTSPNAGDNEVKITDIVLKNTVMANNYTLDDSPAGYTTKYNVAPASLTLTVSSPGDVTYGDKIQQPVSITEGRLYGNDRLSGSIAVIKPDGSGLTAADSSKAGFLNVNKYTIIVDDNVSAIDDGNGGKNYKLTLNNVNHAAFSVKPLSLRLLGLTILTKTYNNSDVVYFDSHGELQGVLRCNESGAHYGVADDVTVVLPAFAHAESSHAGQRWVVAFDNKPQLTGSDAKNYTLEEVDDLRTDINPEPLTVALTFTGNNSDSRHKASTNVVPYGTKIKPAYILKSGQLYADDHITGYPFIEGDSSRFGHWNKGKHLITVDRTKFMVVDSNNVNDYSLTVIDTSFVVSFDPNGDYDRDGITNGEEIVGGDDEPPTDTDPLNPDTDGDGFSDSVEEKAGTDPNDPASYPVNSGGGSILIEVEGADNTRGESGWEIRCPDNGQALSDSVTVNINTPLYYKVFWNGDEIEETNAGFFKVIVVTNQAKSYEETFVLMPPPHSSEPVDTEKIVIHRPFKLFDIVQQKFDNSLYVDLVELKRLGYGDVNAYQWYRDGIEITDGTGIGQVYSLGHTLNNEFNGKDRYAVELTFAGSGEHQLTCSDIPKLKYFNSKVKVYPNPLTAGEELTLEFADEESDSLLSSKPDEIVQIYNLSGMLVHSQYVNGTVNELSLNLPRGIYFLHVKKDVIKIEIE